MNTCKAGLTHYLYKIYVSQARNWHPVDATSVGMTAIIEFSPLNLMRFFSTMHQGKEIEKSAVHQRYSFLFIASHVVRKHFDYQETCRTFFQNHVWIIRHAISAKTRYGIESTATLCRFNNGITIALK